MHILCCVLIIGAVGQKSRQRKRCGIGLRTGFSCTRDSQCAPAGNGTGLHKPPATLVAVGSSEDGSIDTAMQQEINAAGYMGGEKIDDTQLHKPKCKTINGYEGCSELTRHECSLVQTEQLGVMGF